MKGKKTRLLPAPRDTLAEEQVESEATPIPYFRGEGCGNTFLIFDCLNATPETLHAVIKEAHSSIVKEKCDDALILKMEHQDSERLILTMIVLEPDHSIADFCGNGARVVSCYLQHKFGSQKMKYYLKTSRGTRRVWWCDDTFYVDMGKTYL